MNSTDTGSLVFTELDNDMIPPCELGQLSQPCQWQAEWILWKEPCCGGVEHRLACTDCKDARMLSDAGVVCGKCGHLTAPAKNAYVRVESLRG